jgi:hypothetical protein
MLQLNERQRVRLANVRSLEALEREIAPFVDNQNRPRAQWLWRFVIAIAAMIGSFLTGWFMQESKLAALQNQIEQAKITQEQLVATARAATPRAEAERKDREQNSSPPRYWYDDLKTLNYRDPWALRP